MSETATPQAESVALTSTVIGPTRGWAGLPLRELWAYRELLLFLAWRDLKVRYKQTVLGVLWAVIQPVFTMVVFSLFFGRLAGVPSDGLPYPLFAFAALVPWYFFANGITQSANSLVGEANLITKVYFPRLVIPMGSILSGVLDFLMALLVLFGLMAYYDVWPTIRILWLLPLLLFTSATCLAAGLWLSALNVRFRDVRYTIPFLVQLWLFATPVAYPSGLLTEPYRTLFGLNPMTGVVEAFRWCLLGAPAPPAAMIGLSTTVTILFLLTGTLYFRRVERTFADVI